VNEPVNFVVPNAVDCRVYLSSGPIGHWEAAIRTRLPRFAVEWAMLLTLLNDSILWHLRTIGDVAPADMAILIELFPLQMPADSSCRDILQEASERSKKRINYLEWDRTPPEDLFNGEE